MSVIYCHFDLFSLNRKIQVIVNDEVVTEMVGTLNETPSQIINLMNNYNIYSLKFSGPKGFAQAVTLKIKEEAAEKYNFSNEIEVEYIHG